jgi:Protein of unknown function (DUF2934)
LGTGSDFIRRWVIGDPQETTSDYFIGRSKLVRPYIVQVLDRAHQLWEQNGKLTNREDKYYLQAKRELRVQHSIKGVNSDS